MPRYTPITRQMRRRPTFFQRLANRSAIAWIILINVLIYLTLSVYIVVQTLGEDPAAPADLPVLKYFELNPSLIAQGKYLSSIVLHMFTHIYFWHILLNMVALFSLGSLAERIIGRKRFTWFYLAAGLFAGLLSVALALAFGDTTWGARVFGPADIPMMGASGAIFAIAGLYVMLLPRLKFQLIFLPFFSIPAYIMVPAILFGFWILSVAFNLPIGNVAHFGGFIIGIGYGFYLRTKYAKKVRRLQQMFR